MLQREVAFNLCQKVLFQLTHGPLPLQKIADEKNHEAAESKECHAKRPLVAIGMDEHQRVHESRQSAGKDQHKHDGQHRQVKFAALQPVEFLAVEYCRGAHSRCCLHFEIWHSNSTECLRKLTEFEELFHSGTGHCVEAIELEDWVWRKRQWFRRRR